MRRYCLFLVVGMSYPVLGQPSLRLPTSSTVGPIIRPSIDRGLVNTPATTYGSKNIVATATVPDSLGGSRSVFFNAQGLPVGFAAKSSYVGSPTGFRTQMTRNFDANLKQQAVSLTQVHASGFSRTLHYDGLGRRTGLTVTDWLGRRFDYDAEGRLTGRSTDIWPLAVERQEHPFVPRNDEIGSVEHPNSSGVTVDSVDYSGAATWLGISISMAFPTGDAEVENFDRGGVQTGWTTTTIPVSEAGGASFRARSYDPHFARMAESEIHVHTGGGRRAFSYDTRQYWVSTTITTPGGNSFRYDRGGRLIGTSQ